MRVGICDDDMLWSRKAEKIICRYAEQTETQMEVICFTAPEELERYEGYPLDVLFMGSLKRRVKRLGGQMKVLRGGGRMSTEVLLNGEKKRNY